MSMLTLASGSKARAEMLRGAGLDFTVQPADIHESAVIAQGGIPQDVALQLARDKALAVSGDTDGLVIGGDQVLVFDGAVLEKPTTPTEAIERLRAMAGRDHTLILLWRSRRTAICCGRIVIAPF